MKWKQASMTTGKNLKRRKSYTKKNRNILKANLHRVGVENVTFIIQTSNGQELLLHAGTVNKIFSSNMTCSRMSRPNK